MRQPRLRPIPRKGFYRLLEDYDISIRGQRIVVPAVFRCDLASVPAIGWRATYTPYHPIVAAPALVHDWLYLNHQVDRETADLILYDMLLANHADETKAWIMYKAVDVAAFPFWGYSERDMAEIRLLYRSIRWRKQYPMYRFPEHLLEV